MTSITLRINENSMGISQNLGNQLKENQYELAKIPLEILGIIAGHTLYQNFQDFESQRLRISNDVICRMHFSLKDSLAMQLCCSVLNIGLQLKFTNIQFFFIESKKSYLGKKIRVVLFCFNSSTDYGEEAFKKRTWHLLKIEELNKTTIVVKMLLSNSVKQSV